MLKTKHFVGPTWEEVMNEWYTAVLNLIPLYAAQMRKEANHAMFSTRSFRGWAEDMGFEAPGDNRAWGTAMIKAKHAGLVRSCGLTRVPALGPANHTHGAIWEYVK